MAAPIFRCGWCPDRARHSGRCWEHKAAKARGARRRVYDPNHPPAGMDGFVSSPGVSHSEEMTLMIKTTRAYEANLAAMAAAQQIYSSALQIGRSS